MLNHSNPSPGRFAAFRFRRRALILAGLLACQLAHGQARSLTGITEPILDSIMAFPVTGIVSTRFIEEGAAVSKGQVIVELDKRLEELDIERRRFAMQLAQAELDRLKALAQKNTISVSREETDKKQAEFDIARIELELAREVLRRRQILSPVDGFVAQYFRQIGEACDQERTPVVRVVDTARCLFVVDCEPALAQRLTLGQKVRLQFDAPSGVVEVPGVVQVLAPVADAASGLLRVKVIFDNADRRLRPGVAGRMTLD